MPVKGAPKTDKQKIKILETRIARLEKRILILLDYLGANKVVMDNQKEAIEYLMTEDLSNGKKS